MMAQAGGEHGIDCAFVAIDDESTACVEGLGPVVNWRSGDSVAELYAGLGKPGCITVEREAVDIALLRALQSHCNVHPNPDSIRCCQNRRRERQLLRSLDIPCAPHRLASTAEQVSAAAEALGLPLVVKSAESGYDGKNQWRLRCPADVAAFCGGHPRGDWVVEQWVNYHREVSVIAVRSPQGDFRCYPVTENHHRDGILLSSVAPCLEISAEQEQAAVGYARAIMEELNYAGVLAVECFIVDGQVWVNELAPRVHNSGHWTMLPGVTSQFSNHLLAICARPLGATGLNDQYAGMVNILGGYRELAAVDALAVEARVHWYNKSPAPGRKLGHVNINGGSASQVRSAVENLLHSLYGDSPGKGDGSDKPRPMAAR
jgi:5-(carboxyamino)imidazole ribonucleotide synthase